MGAIHAEQSFVAYLTMVMAWELVQAMLNLYGIASGIKAGRKYA